MDGVQTSVLERRVMHRKLYKNARGKAPPWKDVYRKRCVERLRSNRSQLVEHFRSAGDAMNNNPTKIVQDVMEIEWAAMNQGCNLPPLKKSLDDSGAEDQTMLLAVMEEIHHELVSEEEKLLIEVLNYDAAALASQVAMQQSEEVICPVCQVHLQMHGLQESLRGPNEMIYKPGSGPNILVNCSCGLALQGANLTLNTVKSSLENTVSHHGQTCVGQMSFTPTTDTQGANVLITCSVCDWMSFLL
nr:RPA-interacting protein A-like isoform X1 [Procambarus clarkii]